MIDRLVIESEEEACALEYALEEAIQAAHETSVEESEGGSDAAVLMSCKQQMRVLFRLLRRFAPEHPLLEEKPVAGEDFDWSAFWKRVDEFDAQDDESDDDESDEDDDEISGTDETSQPVARVARCGSGVGESAS